MTKLLQLLCFSVLMIGTAQAQNVNIPDANFKAYLVGNALINTNADSEIQTTEASVFAGSINVFNMNIANLTGIGDFTALTSLNCTQNQLTALDVSNSANLTFLSCANNQLTTLEVQYNTALTELLFSFNNIATIDVSANVNLQMLWANANQLTAIDISNNPALTSFSCSSNAIITLDLSTNTALTDITCGTNNLVSLNIANGNNTNITNFGAAANPNLTCIQVDDTTYANTNFTNIDAASSFSTNCSGGGCVDTVYIPDANFKAYLVGNTLINTNSDMEIQCAEAAAFTGQMDANGLNIADLTGIEAFANLTALFCQNNLLTNVDISSNTALTNFSCSYNQLTGIDISNNTALTIFACDNNQITSLDVAAHTALVGLICSNNPLTSLDVSTNTALTDLYCNYNQLTSLDVSTNTALTWLWCLDNQLTSLNVSTNTALIRLYCGGNPLTSLDVSANTVLRELYCESSQLTSLNILSNIDLIGLYCQNNQLTNLDISSNTALNELNCGANQLTALNIKNGNNSNWNGNYFIATNNPNLTCIQVDDVAYANTNFIYKDAGASYSTACTVGTESIITESLHIYPNPTTSVLYIETTENITTKEITDIQGCRIITDHTNSNRLSVSQLPTGIYFLRLTTDKGIHQQKFVKE